MGQPESRPRPAWSPSEEQPASLQEYSAALRRGSLRSPVEAATMMFPMYAVSVKDFLMMTEAKPHQELLAQGLAVKYRQEHGAVTFVSHQWCAKTHPDPDFVQLRCLQGIFQRMRRGVVRLDCDCLTRIVHKTEAKVSRKDLLGIEYMWYDFFSVPQPHAADNAKQTLDLSGDLGKAVFSLPAYIQMCKLFIVLAPPVAHQDFPERTVDYHSWKQRGWCRLERLARVLAPGNTHVLLARRPDVLQQMRVEDWLFDAVGAGDFSEPSDRERLAPVVCGLVQRKLAEFVAAGELRDFRRLMENRGCLLDGLPIAASEVHAPGLLEALGVSSTWNPVDAFLRVYGFASPTDRAGGTADPILFAARAGDLPVVAGLLDRRADVGSKEGKAIPEWIVVPGATPLHKAAVGRGPDVEAVITLLLNRRADIEARNCNRTTPLHGAAYSGNEVAMETLLKAGANSDCRDYFGASPASVLALSGRSATLKLLLEHGATLAPNAAGVGPLWVGAAFGAGEDLVTQLVCARCDPDVQFQPIGRREAAPGAGRNGLRVLSLPHRLWGSTNTFSFAGYHARGATALMAAAVVGHCGEARALVAAGADPSVRNSRGKTAAELAELVGLPPEQVAFFR